jgi:RimJ/RimL family protein N-acetyltransferase
MKVLEKSGYKLEGRLRKSVIKDGQILDQMVYAILKEELTPREFI